MNNYSRCLMIGIFSVLLLGNNVFSAEMTSVDRAKYGKAVSLFNLKRYDEAETIFKDLSKYYTDHKTILRYYAESLAYIGQMDKSTVIFNKLFKSVSDDRELLELYAGLLESNKFFGQAALVYEKLWKLNPAALSYGRKAADNYSWNGEYDKSTKLFQDLIVIIPDDNDLALQYADVLYWARRYDDSISAYQTYYNLIKRDKTRMRNLARAYLAGNDYENAVLVVSDVLSFYPTDIELKVEYANAVLLSGDTENAEKLFYELVNDYKVNMEVVEDIVRMLASLKFYDKAINVCLRWLEVYKENEGLRLWLARIYSWDRKYQESIIEYDNLIDSYSPKLEYFREKARVLGWMREYRDSEIAYKEAIEKFPDHDALQHEEKALYSDRRYYHKTAIEEYKKWLLIEPNDPEALSNSAQLYSRLEKRSKAAKNYTTLLIQNPEQFRVEQSQEKNQIYLRETLSEEGFIFYESDSGSRLADVKYYNIYQEFSHPLNEKIKVRLRYDNQYYRFPETIFRLNRYRLTTGIEYVDLPDIRFNIGYGFSDKTDRVESSHSGYANAYLQPCDPLKVHLKYARDDVDINVETLRRHLQKDDYGTRLVYTPHRRWFLGADAMYSNYTDGNNRFLWGIDLNAHIFYSPRRLSITYRYEEYGFSKARDWYFSPNSFHSNGIGLEWRHYLNSEELYWGSNDTYYTFRYMYKIERDGIHGHVLFMDFHHDWTDRVSTHLDVQKIIYENESIYGDTRISAYLRWYF